MTATLGWITLPDFLPRAAQSFPTRPLRVGDVATITFGPQVKRYEVSTVHENGECDLTALPPTCGLCSLPMPKDEEMFRYHGFSGPCPTQTATP